MAFLTDSVILLVWFLVFVIILFLYVDIRVGKLRKELLSHYALCERMITSVMARRQGYGSLNSFGHYGGYGNGNGRSTHADIFPPVISTAVDDDIIPTREEMAHGLMSLDNMQPWQHASWSSQNQQSAATSTPETHSHQHLQPFDTWEFQGGDFAPFNPLRYPL